MWEYLVARVTMDGNGTNQRVVEVDNEQQAPRNKWGSYDTDKAPKMKDFLAMVGDQGWELISVLPVLSSTGGNAHFYFKRSKG